MVRRLTPLLLLSILLLSLVPTLGATALPPQRARPAGAQGHSLTAVTIGMGYIPSVQFAPFYVADQRSYYRRAGLDVTFSYAGSPNLLQLVGAGRLDFANADGTDVIASSARGVPVVYVMAEYQRLPVAIFALARSRIRAVADLRGKTIGIPFLFGSGYDGLLAALRSAGLRPRDVHIEAIGYNQVQFVATGRVDAAVGYSTNEPLVLARRGYRVTTLEVGSVTNLVAPGVVTGRGLIARHPALVRAFVRATLHGLADTIRDPAMAFAAARRINGLTALSGRAVGDQYAVLQRAITFWHGAKTQAHGLGYADPTQWRDSARILQSIGRVPAAPPVAAIYTNTFAQGAAKL